MMEKEESDIWSMLSLEGEEEKVKEGKGITILTPKKLTTRLPVLLPQIKVGNSS